MLPQLLELSLSDFKLAAPAGAAAVGAAFGHLTRLDLRNCEVPELAPAPRLGTLMPRLEVARCSGEYCCGCGTAAAGHPTLRELQLCLQQVNDPGDASEWLDTLETLPRLSDLRLRVSCSSFDDENDELRHIPAWRIARVSEALRGCSAVTPLDFSAVYPFFPHIQDMLATVGAAAGERLAWLRLDGVHLKRTPEEEARAFFALPLYYPRLKHLEIVLDKFQVFTPAGLSMDESLTAMLRTLEVVLPHCPALSRGGVNVPAVE